MAKRLKRRWVHWAIKGGRTKGHAVMIGPGNYSFTFCGRWTPAETYSAFGGIQRLAKCKVCLKAAAAKGAD